MQIMNYYPTIRAVESEPYRLLTTADIYGFKYADERPKPTPRPMKPAARHVPSPPAPPRAAVAVATVANDDTEPRRMMSRRESQELSAGYSHPVAAPSIAPVAAAAVSPVASGTDEPGWRADYQANRIDRDGDRLQAVFKTEHHYIAFKRAESRGRVGPIIGGRVETFKQK